MIASLHWGAMGHRNIRRERVAGNEPPLNGRLVFGPHTTDSEVLVCFRSVLGAGLSTAAVGAWTNRPSRVVGNPVPVARSLFAP